MRKMILIFIVLIANGVFSVAHAIPLSLTILDPQGDHTGTTDLLSINMSFDNDTGAYDIFYNSDPSYPFTGSFRINVNLRNITLLGVPPRSPDFSDTLNDFSLSVDTTQIQLSGVSAALLNWNLNDEIAYILPGAGGFSTSGVKGDSLGPSTPDSPMMTTFVDGESVPEPVTVILIGLGLAGIGYRRRKQIKSA